MNRKEAIKIISKRIGNDPIIAANGFISRDLFDVCDKRSNFYMIGSMGLASSIGLGVAILNPKKRIFIFDGDGNILMNLGSLTTIGKLKPKNLVHLVFDNQRHESTGGQPSNTKNIDLYEIAKSSNYNAFKANSKTDLKKIFRRIKNIHGPILILVRITSGGEPGKRITHSPVTIKKRFSRNL